MIQNIRCTFVLCRLSLGAVGLILAAALFSSPAYANYDSCIAAANSAYDDGVDAAERSLVAAGSTAEAEESYYNELDRLSAALTRSINSCGQPPPPVSTPEPLCPDGTSTYEDPECDGSSNGEDSPEDHNRGGSPFVGLVNNVCRAPADRSCDP